MHIETKPISRDQLDQLKSKFLKTRSNYARLVIEKIKEGINAYKDVPGFQVPLDTGQLSKSKNINFFRFRVKQRDKVVLIPIKDKQNNLTGIAVEFKHQSSNN